MQKSDTEKIEDIYGGIRENKTDMKKIKYRRSPFSLSPTTEDCALTKWSLNGRIYFPVFSHNTPDQKPDKKENIHNEKLGNITLIFTRFRQFTPRAPNED